jgi:hypothetical protein
MGAMSHPVFAARRNIPWIWRVRENILKADMGVALQPES